MRLRIVAGLILAAVLGASVGCKSAEPTAIKLVPRSATMIVQAQIGKILSDQDVAEAYNKTKKSGTQPQTLDEALNKLTEETGLNLRDFSNVLLFGDVMRVQNPQARYVGLIAEGSFDEKSFVASVEAKSSKKLVSSDYKGYTIYTDEVGKFSLTFLGTSVMVFGSTQAVKDTIDVRKGDQQPVTGAILDTFNRFGDSLAKLALIVPPEARASIDKAASGTSPMSMKAFGNMDIVGFGFNKEMDNLVIRIDAHFQDTTSAQDAKDTISGMISVFKGLLQAPEAKSLLGKIETTANGEWLTISLKTTAAEIEQLAGGFQSRLNPSTTLPRR